MVLSIVSHKDPFLRSRSEPVEVFNEDFRLLVRDMIETLYAAGGVGLAAIQIGVPLQVFVVDVHAGTRNIPSLYVFVNPTITKRQGEIECIEGCLSIPGERFHTRRPASTTIRAQDEYGTHFELHATGMLSVAINHEFDHLRGWLVSDFSN
jgi:peptide deformylase